jgi:hypothetical protein
MSDPPYESGTVSFTNVPLGYKLPLQHFDSLARLWSTWYQEYYKADFPRLFIRYEDTLLHAEQVTRAVLECAGQETANDRFVYHLAPAKKHGKPVDLVAAILKATHVEDRRGNLTNDDVQVAREHLDPELMKALHYAYV